MLRIALALVLKRSPGLWLLLATVLLGALLAVAIGSGTLVYFDSLSNLALQKELEKHDPEDLDVLLRARAAPVTARVHEETVGLIENRVDRDLSSVLAGHSYGFKSATFYIGDRVPPEEDRRRAFLAVLPGLHSHVRLEEGRWPDSGSERDRAGRLVVEAALPVDAARALGLGVGDRLELRPTWRDDPRGMIAAITGLYRRTQPEEPFWRVYDKGFGVAASRFVFAALIVPQETFVSDLGAQYPDMVASYAWQLDTDPARIKASNSDRIRESLNQMRSEMRNALDGYQQITKLDATLRSFDTRLFFSKVPMLVVGALVVIAVLYYVLTLSSLLVEARLQEISLLRTRGATGRHIAALYAIEALALAFISVAAGPLLAVAGVRLLGMFPGFSGLNAGAPVPAAMTQQAYIVALVAGAITFLALLVPAARAARVGLLQVRRAEARPARASLFQHYYLDLMLLGIALLLFWQLRVQGSFVVTRLIGDEAVDQLILAMPALFLVAAGLFLLRVFPVSMELLARLLSSRPLARVTPPVLVLGILTIARNPTHYARLSLLLILASGLGVFAASFSATLERSFQERVLYDAGADLRTVGMRSKSPRRIERARLALPLIEGVEAVTPVARTIGSFTAGAFVHTYTMLGVDPQHFAEIGWSRPDFTPGTLREALRPLSDIEHSGVPIPAGARWLTARIRPAESRPDVAVFAQISDANGRIFPLRLGTLLPAAAAKGVFPCPLPAETEAPTWCRLVGDLRWLEQAGPTPEAPLRLEFIGLAEFGVDILPRAGSLDISDIVAAADDGSLSAVLHRFDGAEGRRTADPAAGLYRARAEEATDQSGGVIAGVTRLIWSVPEIRHLSGLALGGPRSGIPVIASRTFLEQAGASVGDQRAVFLGQHETVVRIVGSARYFPTLDPSASPFLIADVREIRRASNIDRLVVDDPVSEFWVNAEAGQLAAGEVERFLAQNRLGYQSVVHRDALLAESRLDPLSSAGWEALLAVGFGAVLLTSALGFAVHALVSFRARRSDLAALRALGLSSRQLLLLTLLEQLLVIGPSVALGIVTGSRLGATILPYMSTSGEGLKLVPPLVVEIDWGAFGATFGLAAGVFAIVIGFILVAVHRMSLHAALRVANR